MFYSHRSKTLKQTELENHDQFGNITEIFKKL